MPKRAAEVDTSLVLVEIPRAVRVPDACPEPWAHFEPVDLPAVSDGTVVTFWEDISGNNRHLYESPDGESKVKVRTVGGMRVIYHDEVFAQQDLLSARWDGGGHIDFNETSVGTSFSPDMDAFTLYVEVVSNDWSDFSVFVQFHPFNDGMRLNQNVWNGDLFSEGEAFADDLGWPPGTAPMPTGLSWVVTRYDRERDRAELLLNGTLVDVVEGLQEAGGTWGFSTEGLAASSGGGVGRMVMWDEWVPDECFPRAVRLDCLAPWAWYRDDDLTGFSAGDPVTQWNDRMPGARHLLALDDGRNTPLYAEGGGITGDPAEPNGTLQAEYAGQSFTDLSVTVVLDGVSGDIHPFVAGSGAGVIGSFQSELFWFPGFAYIGAYAGDAFAENNSYIAATGPATITFGRTVDGVIRYWVNGVEYTDWEFTADSTVAFELAWHLLQVKSGSVRHELIVFDQFVDPATTQVDLGGCTTLNAYLAARYPSLGVG